MAPETQAQPITTPRPQPTPAKAKSGAWRWVALLLVLGAAGAGGAYWYLHRNSHEEAAGATTTEGESAAGEAGTSAVRVEATHPRPGGIEHVTTQPGTVHAFEYADLFAEASGFLHELHVDIGDDVTQNQILAVLSAPDLEKAVQQAQAALEQAKAQAKQAEARVKTAEADLQANEAKVEKSKVDLEQATENRVYRSKVFNRIQDLVRRGAAEQRLADEEEDRFKTAQSGESAAQVAVQSARAELAAAKARVEQAKADLEEAKSNIDVAQADLEKAQVFVAFTQIHSPYNGVVTHRNFFRGDFIRSASDGNTTPLLSVARTDKMRVVVMVPDRDVPFVDRGDPATVRIDALPGREFQGTVSRFADSEDPASRTMRTEIDLPNPDDILREGMYGGVTILLEPAAANSVTVPSSCLMEQAEGQSQWIVYRVIDGKAQRTVVQVGKDTGVEAEILKGLSAEDLVVTRVNGAITDGMTVQAEEVKTESKAEPAS